METWLIGLAHTHTIFVYFIVLFLAFAEGPLLSMVFGVLIKLGYFDLIPVYTILMVGDLIGDTALFCLGYFYGYRFIRRFGKYVHITEAHVEKVKHIFHKYKHPILFLSKITNGLGGFSSAVLVTAGIVKLPFPVFFIINFIGQFVWTGMLIAVGYFFGHAYVSINNALGRGFLIVIFLFVLFVLLKYIKFMKNKYLKP